jgi:DNA-binding CsgD family transcriptional regulator
MLVGRVAETDRLDLLVDGLREGRSGAVVLRGEAGIGKTALLRHAQERARSHSMTVLRASGVESEFELAFCALADLLRPLLGELAHLPGPQAAALEGALALGPPMPGDRFAIATATLGLLSLGAEKRPIVVLIDDAQWIDGPSLSTLVFTARRLNAEGVLMIFAERDSEPSTLQGLDVMRVDGLDDVAAKALLAITGPPLSPAVADAISAAAAGNPLALIEVPISLRDAQRAGVEPLDEPLRAGPQLTKIFERRLDALSDGSRRCLLVAAAGDLDDAASISEALATLGLDPSDLDIAEVADLVFVVNGRLSWRHPLVRAVVYHGASNSARRSTHAALASVFSAESEADRRAWHLAAAVIGHDEAAASALELSATNARLRRGNAAAGRAFERAARLTADPEERARRLFEAAMDLLGSAQPDRAGALLNEAYALSRRSLFRADVQRARALLEMFCGTPGPLIELLISEADRVESEDPSRAAAMRADACVAATITGDVKYTLQLAVRALEAARLANPHAVAMSQAMLGNALILAGRGKEATVHLRAARESFEHDGLPPFPFVLHLVQTLGHSSIWLEDMDEARQFLGGVLTSARAQEAVRGRSFPLACLSELAYRSGRWTDAYALAVESQQVAEAVGERSELAFSLECLARVESATGKEEACRAHVAESLRICIELGIGSIEVYAHSTLGLLELGLGHPDAALLHLEPLSHLVDRYELEEPNVVRWASDFVEAHARAGNVDRALSALAKLDKQAEMTERRWTLGEVARCRGLLTDDENFDRRFAEALEWHVVDHAPFEHARTLLCLGERRRRAKRSAEAREPLALALATFEQLGALPWVQRARQELRASGVRLGPLAEPLLERLTPQELQVALAVGEGMTNREAAAALFVSPKTVDYHLGKVYRKLAVKSRSELAALIAKQTRQDAVIVSSAVSSPE